MRSTAACLAAVMVLAVLAREAQAHKLHVFAAVDGKVIRGETYFRGGAAAARVPVQALGPAGQLLGQTTTDDQGQFALPVRFRCEHRLVVDAGGGHTAEYRIAEKELPADLPPPGERAIPAESCLSNSPPQALPPANAQSANTIGKHVGPDALGDAPPMPSETSDLVASIETLRAQVLQLRQEFDEFRQEIRLHDVLGGIGYILGLMGMVLYVVNRRRTSQG